MSRANPKRPLGLVLDRVLRDADAYTRVGQDGIANYLETLAAEIEALPEIAWLARRAEVQPLLAIPPRRFPGARGQSQQYDVRPVVYALYNADTGLTKIGITGDLNARQSALESGSGCGLALIASVAGEMETTRQAEAVLHHRYGADRKYGEWFALDEDTRAMLSDVMLEVMQNV